MTDSMTDLRPVPEPAQDEPLPYFSTIASNFCASQRHPASGFLPALKTKTCEKR
jgi:hypothetical protein